MDDNSVGELTLPGFRFHPTEEELVSCYLKRIASGKKLPSDIIGFLNIYHHDPWELPGNFHASITIFSRYTRKLFLVWFRSKTIAMELHLAYVVCNFAFLELAQKKKLS